MKQLLCEQKRTEVSFQDTLSGSVPSLRHYFFVLVGCNRFYRLK
jgi:hypothetical protein